MKTDSINHKNYFKGKTFENIKENFFGNFSLNSSLNI